MFRKDGFYIFGKVGSFFTCKSIKPKSNIGRKRNQNIGIFQLRTAAKGEKIFIFGQKTTFFGNMITLC